MAQEKNEQTQTQKAQEKDQVPEKEKQVKILIYTQPKADRVWYLSVSGNN